MLLSAVTHGFIGCYGVVHGCLRWRGETGVMPQTSQLGVTLSGLFFHINDFCQYDLMHLSKLSAHDTEWGHAKVLPIGLRTC